MLRFRNALASTWWSLRVRPVQGQDVMRDFLRSFAVFFALAALVAGVIYVAAQWSPTVGRWLVFVPLVVLWTVFGGGGA